MMKLAVLAAAAGSAAAFAPASNGKCFVSMLGSRYDRSALVISLFHLANI